MIKKDYYFEGSETFYANCVAELETLDEENIEIALWASQR